MKKVSLFKSITYLFLTIISITSCDVSDKKNETDLEKENLKGEVVFVQILGLSLKPHTEFNENGFIKRKILSIPKISYYEETEYFYLNDKISKEILYKGDEDGLSSFIGNYKYDGNGNLSIIEKQYSKDILQTINYRYKDHLLIEEIEVGDPDYNQHTLFYYTKGILDSSIVKSGYINTKSHITKNYYNHLGQLVKKDWTDGKDDFSFVYYYDDNGLVIKQVDIKGENIETNLINYEYDNRGNWVKKYFGGKLNVERKIYYKGDDYSKIINELDENKRSLQSNSKISQEDNSRYINSSSSNQNTYSNQNQQSERQKQWVNCPSCVGRGELVCRECNGTTLMFCGSCDGRGTFQGKTCYLCKGALKVKCTPCYGKGTKGRCDRCHGKGQISE